MQKFIIIHCCYENIEADTISQAKSKALEWFYEVLPTIHVEEIIVSVFGNVVDTPLTNSIHSVITSCPSLNDEDSLDKCARYCPFAKICYDYWKD